MADHTYRIYQMYHMKQEENALPLEQYLQRYRETGDQQELVRFLHHYEPTMNRMVKRFCFHYGVQEHFQDLKQTLAITLMMGVPHYDPAKGTLFSAFRNDMKTVLHRYVRVQGGAHHILTDGRHRTIRRIAFLYFNTPEKSGDALISYIAQQVGMRTESVSRVIVEALDFRYWGSIYQDDADGWFFDWVEDTGFSTQRLAINGLVMDTVVDALESLSFKERQVLLGAAGVACMYCGKVSAPMTYADIASRFELSSESAGEKLYKKAKLHLLPLLYESGLLDYVVAKQMKRDKQSTLYSYRPRCDGEEGIIRVETSKQDKASVSIETLADLDTTLTHRYAERVIHALEKSSGVLPKNLLLVWWV